METLTLTLFTPSEAERITGVSTALQRDWRRRGYLPKSDSHARFEVFDLARLTFMKWMAERGVGPQQTHEIAEWAARGIVWEIFSVVDGWEGDHRAVLPPKFQHEWGLQRNYLIGKIWALGSHPRVIPGQFFIWWADGEHTWTPSIDLIRNNMTSDDSRLSGPFICVDQMAMAGTIQERAGRAFCHVEAPADSDPARQ
jgi:DNA-binding transcriptional MerR regulator